MTKGNAEKSIPFKLNPQEREHMVEDLINKGASLGAKGYKITSVDGPFDGEDCDVYIINVRRDSVRVSVKLADALIEELGKDNE